MFRIPTVLTADELIDKALRKASRVNIPPAKSKFEMVRRKNLAKIDSVSDSICSALEGYVKAFPSLEKLPPFYRDLIDLLLDLDQLKKSLGAIDWCSHQIARMTRAAKIGIKRSRSLREIDEIREDAYGRCASLVRQVKEELEFLGKARDQIMKLPNINPEMRTIVVAGAPNVGKSLLVSNMSTAKPKVASYPFTTKEITVGMFTLGRRKYQIIDTPGLLDRPLEEKNEIELQAIIALRNLADLVLFILDPTGTCGYPIEYQESLLRGIRKLYPNINTITIENKADILKRDNENIKISALTKDGLDELKKRIEKELPSETESKSFSSTKFRILNSCQ